MTSPNSTFTEMVTTTLREHPNAISDNVSDHNGLYNRLKKKGRVMKSLSGGYEIAEPLDYAENSTWQRYSGYDTLNISASDVFTAAKYDWVQAAVSITASGRDLRMNSGKNQIIDLMKARTKNAMRTAANNMSIDLYSDGALSNQMGGLAHIVQNDGTGTVGGINSSTYAFWANQYREMSGTGTWSKSTIKNDMKQMWLTCVRGTDKPDLIVSTHDFYTAYWDNLSDLQRYRNDDLPDTFTSVKFMSADVIFDSNDNFSTTGEKMYFLNTDYLSLRYHPDANWTPLEEKSSANQDAAVVSIIFQGQLTCSNRARQGVLIDAT
jgi:hypothetical protein